MEDLHELFSFAEDVKFAMLSTKAEDGNIISRPMELIKRINNVDFYMLATKDSEKAEQVKNDEHVGLSLFRNSDYSWATISGVATLVEDREKIKELYSFFLRPYFDDKGDGVHDGSENDPRIVLIKFTSQFARYQIQKNTISHAYQLAKSALTGSNAKLADTKTITKEQFDKA
ncbi:hypothetical protein L0F63_004577, partial [Massospora cicadina]